MKETRTIDGIEYKVFLRRVTPPQEKSNVRNRRETGKNGIDEKSTNKKVINKKTDTNQKSTSKKRKMVK